MELFLDTANLEEISTGINLGVITGVTTNPTLIAKEKVEYKSRILEICKLVAPGPVSVEVLTQEAESMYKEALEYSSWAPNVVIKVPIGKEGLKALKLMHAAHIKTNVTLVFSLNQALLAAISGATYVSPFVGRLDD
ncbi:MAG: transaldolase family protein, partial [bacterium]